MILKLAYRNVRKSYQDFMIYFVTLMFSVCLFYTFNSFQAQQEMMVLRESQNTVMGTTAIFMVILSIFIAMVLAFLILYANRFLIRRRKKEFGLYMLLGMEERVISRILIAETFFIGLISMVFGLLLGIACSQVLAVVSAKLMEVEVHFHLVFSLSAMIMTIVAFGVIFLFTMISNARVLRKQKLIDLISADKQQEKQRLHSFPFSILLFLCSLLLLGLTYYLATVSLLTFSQFFVPILVMGATGTVLFFFSLTGFLLRFTAKSKRIYYRNLHMFVLRQVHSRINTSFLSMSIVCLMLLLSIGALATGWNLNLGLSQTYGILAPYDMSYLDYNGNGAPVVEERLLSQQSVVHVYQSDVLMSDLYPHMGNSTMHEMFNYNLPLDVVPYSQYVNFCEQKGLTPVALKDANYILYAPMKDALDLLQEVQNQDVALSFYGVKLHPGEEAVYFQPDTNEAMEAVGVILPDDMIPANTPLVRSAYNYDVKEGVDIAQFQKEFDAQLQSEMSGWQTTSRVEVYDSYISMGMLFTYIGLYLGIVFLMASAVLLALQQLSQADHNIRQYEILRKIGVEKKMMNHSIYEQIGIYFLLPLVLASIHAYFGIQAVAGSFALVFGTGSLAYASLLSAAVIIVIYGIYFLFTVKGYQRILLHND